MKTPEKKLNDVARPSELQLRAVTPADASQLLAIYEPYVRGSHATFETEVPTVPEYESRIQKICEGFPYYVAVIDGKIIGFAYASLFRERAAYAWALECSVYLDQRFQGHTTRPAYKLYEKIFAELKARDVKQVIAVISLPNERSVRFHESMDFKPIGIFPSVGFKQGKWWDVLFMTKLLENLPFSPPMI